MPTKKSQIAIVTTCPDDWGGSEELWSRSIPYLQQAGYKVVVYKSRLNKSHPGYKKLAAIGVELKELTFVSLFSLPKRIKRKLLNRFNTYNKNFYSSETHLDYLMAINKPDLVIIAQGTNFEGLGFARISFEKAIPYVLIAQKAIDIYWPPNHEKATLRKLYQNALKSYFVSISNKTLTEEQFGTRFSNAEVISNPIKVHRKMIPMPDTKKGYRLACIGRYSILDKGQDILIRVMAMPKWKERAISVSFIGAGDDKAALMEMAQLLEATNIEFLDQVENIETVWHQYHALILPSRSEGMPLVLLEAMACGRIGIVTTAGGNPELVTDGFNGFIGQANEKEFDLALERAWAVRNNWEELAMNAYEFIEKNIPANPEQCFAQSIKYLLQKDILKVPDVTQDI